MHVSVEISRKPVCKRDAFDLVIFRPQEIFSVATHVGWR